ncbi:ribonuclease HII [bacterium]|nr:ribonuclease HII [bacterium]
MQYVIGIDEAGRGPLAGPVAVGVVLIPKNFRPKTNLTKISLKDSKKLSEQARKAWFEYIKTNPNIIYAVAMVYPKTIDRINIARAADLAATRALKRLISKIRFSASKTQIYLDAGIRIKANEAKSYKLKAIVRGDERITTIKLASIAAKVRRDAYITKKHKKYPKYEFHKHKGYGTKIHLKALKKHGLSPIHRLTFISKYSSI